MANQLDNLSQSRDAEPDASFRMVVFDDEIVIRYDGEADTIVQHLFDSIKAKPAFTKELNKVIFNEFLTQKLYENN